jgi:hypothetical protein
LKGKIVKEFIGPLTYQKSMATALVGFRGFHYEHNFVVQDSVAAIDNLRNWIFRQMQTLPYKKIQHETLAQDRFGSGYVLDMQVYTTREVRKFIREVIAADENQQIEMWLAH